MKTALIILWQTAKEHQSDILSDMRQRFDNLKIYEISWSKDYVIQNFNRFFEQHNTLENIKSRYGTGAFYVCIAESINCDEERSVKTKYLSVCGNQYAVYVSVSDQQLNRDAVLLLGKSIEDLKKEPDFHTDEITRLNRDLEGAQSWDNLAQFFYVLNNSINYVVLRNFESLPNHFDPSIHGDIDLLVENLGKIVSLTNARKKFPENPTNVAYYVPFAEGDIQFDFRYLGDNYLDKAWETDILRSAHLYAQKSADPFMVMSSIHQYYTLLYHAYVQKINIASDYPAKLNCFASEIGEKYKNDVDYSMRQLWTFMKEHNYHISIPSEWEGTLNWQHVRCTDEYLSVRTRYIIHPGIWLFVRSLYLFATKAMKKIVKILKNVA